MGLEAKNDAISATRQRLAQRRWCSDGIGVDGLNRAMTTFRGEGRHLYRRQLPLPRVSASDSAGRIRTYDQRAALSRARVVGAPHKYSI